MKRFLVAAVIGLVLCQHLASAAFGDRIKPGTRPHPSARSHPNPTNSTIGHSLSPRTNAPLAIRVKNHTTSVTLAPRPKSVPHPANSNIRVGTRVKVVKVIKRRPIATNSTLGPRLTTTTTTTSSPLIKKSSFRSIVQGLSSQSTFRYIQPPVSPFDQNGVVLLSSLREPQLAIAPAPPPTQPELPIYKDHNHAAAALLRMPPPPLKVRLEPPTYNDYGTKTSASAGYALPLPLNPLPTYLPPPTTVADLPTEPVQTIRPQPTVTSPVPTDASSQLVEELATSDGPSPDYHEPPNHLPIQLPHASYASHEHGLHVQPAPPPPSYVPHSSPPDHGQKHLELGNYLPPSLHYPGPPAPTVAAPPVQLVAPADPLQQQSTGHHRHPGPADHPPPFPNSAEHVGPSALYPPGQGPPIYKSEHPSPPLVIPIPTPLSALLGPPPPLHPFSSTHQPPIAPGPVAAPPPPPAYPSPVPHVSYTEPEPDYNDLDGPLPYPGVSGVPGIGWRDFPMYAEIPATGFDCRLTKYPGFYADIDTGCQVWHYCQLDGRHDAFLCPNGTLFNQDARVCDWWFNVRCPDSPFKYGINADLYQDPNILQVHQYQKS